MDSNKPKVVTVNFDINNPIGSKISFVPDGQIEITGLSGQVIYNLPETAGLTFAPNPIRFLDGTEEMRIFPAEATVNRVDNLQTKINLTLPATFPAGQTAAFHFRVILQNADQTFRSSDPTIVIMRPDGR